MIVDSMFKDMLKASCDDMFKAIFSSMLKFIFCRSVDASFFYQLKNSDTVNTNLGPAGIPKYMFLCQIMWRR